MNTLPLWLQITGIVVGVLTGIVGTVLGILNVMWRRRDRQSRMKIDYYLGADPPRAWAKAARLAHTSTPYPVVMFRVENVGGQVCKCVPCFARPLLISGGVTVSRGGSIRKG